MKSRRTRVFVGLMLGAELGRAVLEEALAALDPETRALVRVPRADGLHLTLAFLGSVERGWIADLRGALEAELANAAAPVLALAARGAFPGRKRPRVMFVRADEAGGPDGIGAEGRLARLFERTTRAVAAAARRTSGDDRNAAHPSADEPFRPHITVARLRAGARVKSGAWKDFWTIERARSWKPREVAIVESERTHDGPPRYRALERIALSD